MVNEPDAPATPAGAPLVLETKLYTPRRPAGMVERPRLVDRIGDGAGRKLTVLSAPAGSGKTTLLAEWLAERPLAANPVGWVSLDAGDNDPASFWSCFIRALQRVRPGLGQAALAALGAGSPPTVAVLTSLINEIAALDDDVVVILDDYHVIEVPAVHSALAFFLDHLPPRMHLILATRVDPLLPVARLRARGELVELRAADLRFSPDEATLFLNRVMTLDLSAADVVTLGQRTEGWVAGLKLAALSMQGHEDVRGFIDAFSGDSRYVADYLIEEVLDAQPDRVRRFLLGTAILDRLSAPLCDAVTGEAGSQALLDALEKGNLFVVALDDRREWYRYHHLFAEMLQAYARRADPARLRDLHRRASAWYEQNGTAADAVQHALQAEDLERVAELLERSWPAMDRSYRTGRWLARVRALPDALVRARPVLDTGYAWALLNAGELEAAGARLDDVEASLASGSIAPIVADEARFRSLPRELATARIYLAQALGDAGATIEHARLAIELVPEGDHAARATATALLGLAHWAAGELDAAHRTFTDALAGMRLAGETGSAIRGVFVLGDIRVAQGRLRDATRTYESGLELAAAYGPAGAAETDELYLGLGEVQR
ncbi:MAG TPA: hypothetical protein VK928_11680, partial [Longimicrobiales bacterium]|nr:hypothetical protein [Longimicrobiales bacterium]